MRELLLVLLVLGCGAAADDGIDDAPIDAAPAEAEPAPPPGKPLCPGEDEPVAGECQQLVYGERGYCNRWVDCATLH